LLARVDLQPPVPNGPVTLVMVSSTLSGGGLLVDFGPALRICGIALALSIVFWIPLVRGITGSIAKLRDATAEIAVRKFDIRVNDRRGDEIGERGSAINTMAERLAGLMNGQRRFLSDVAHELCAPLSRLQVALGILEERSRDEALPPEQLQVRLSDLREEVDHMAGLVNELLSFSRAALGTNQARLTTIELLPVLEGAVRREAVEGCEILVECPPHLRATADPDLLGRSIGNLVRNAIRYAGHAGPVRIAALPHAEGVHVTVSDQGPGVPADALPQLFDPFYRVDTSRTRETGGVGLGLTIARTCVEACGGTIRARNREQGGLEVEIALHS
jgi:two-component system sensor histidine kinase CpxA